MYYLYHIKGLKWGCSIRLEKRLNQQGYNINDCDRIIIVNDIDKAADMERELNLEYGYGWNESQDYRVIMKAHKKTYTFVERKWNGYVPTYEQCALGGKITGNKKGKKQQKARINNVAKINVYRTCPYCNLTTRGAAYFRYHGDNCKLNPSPLQK